MNNSEEEVRDIQYGVPQKLFFNFAILFGPELPNGVQVHHKKFRIYGPKDKKSPALFSFTL